MGPDKHRLSSRKQADVVVCANSLPGFIRLLNSPSECQVRGILAIGNIAQEENRFRDLSLSLNALEAEAVGHLKHLRRRPGLCWSVQCLQYLAYVVVRPCLVLVPLPHHPKDEIIAAVLSALSSISEGHADRVQALLDAADGGALPRIVQLLVEPRCPEIQRGAIRTIGNVASGNKRQTKLVVDSDTARRETCWTFSNVLCRIDFSITSCHPKETPTALPLILTCSEDTQEDGKKEAVHGQLPTQCRAARSSNCGNSFQKLSSRCAT